MKRVELCDLSALLQCFMYETHGDDLDTIYRAIDVVDEYIEEGKYEK